MNIILKKQNKKTNEINNDITNELIGNRFNSSVVELLKLTSSHL